MGTLSEVTLLQVARCWIYAPSARIALHLPSMNAAAKEAEVNSPLRWAMWLAQWGHECAEGRYMEEIADGNAYDPRVNPRLAQRLGNTFPGDGPRFKGRGPCQLTGRANYARAGEALGLNLIANPDQVAKPDVGWRVAAWFWRAHQINEAADKGDVLGATRIINGGANGIEDREQRYERACDALGV